MATTKLTERQQEVHDLLDQGKTPSEIAKALGISENAVYQQRARIRKAQGKRSARRTTARKSSGGRSRRPQPRPTPAPAPAPGNAANTTTTRPLTPLQAIRHRKSEIEAEVKEAGTQVAQTAKAHEKAQEHLAKVRSANAEELAKLEAAEAALSNAKPKKRAPRSNGKGNAQAARAAAAQAAPAAPAAPQPAAQHEQPAPEGEEAAALVGAEEERPGVPVDPDFDQNSQDGFGEESAA